MNNKTNNKKGYNKMAKHLVYHKTEQDNVK